MMVDGKKVVDTYRIDFGESCFRPISVKTGEELRAEKKPFHVTLSEDQERAYEQISHWLRRQFGKLTCHYEPDLLTLGGYAGSGKSTLITLLAKDNPHLTIAFVSVTGRATGNMRRKMGNLGVSSARHVYMTLHSLLYQSFTTPDGRLRWTLKERDSFGLYDLIVIDEASMVTEKMLEDLQNFGCRILGVGDHGQLPPVGGAGALMRNPDLKLEKIHRQAEGNPILELSQHVREKGDLPFRPPGGDQGLIQYVSRTDGEKLLRRLYAEMELPELATLAWRNRTRVNMNALARRIHKRGDKPEAGDQVLCLKNAYRLAFNGMRGFLKDIRPTPSPHYYCAEVEFQDDNLLFQGDCSSLFFDRPKMIESLEELEADGMFVEDWEDIGFLLDYGYCMTVHKAQGSQFDTVVYVRERPDQTSSEMFKRHLYTGITRAEKRLYVLV